MSRKILLLAILTLLAGGSCADNRASFFIMFVPTAADDCTVEDSESGTYLTTGHWDIALTDSYFLGLLLKNQLTPVESADDYIAETNGIQVEGANIRIFRGVLARGAEEWKGYVSAASYVPPGDTTATAVVIPSDAHRALSALGDDSYVRSQLTSSGGFPVTVGVKLIGKTNGNTDVETPEFFFTIMLYEAMLVTCVYDSETGEPCVGSEDVMEVCLPGQDGYLSCDLCSATIDADACRAPCM